MKKAKGIGEAAQKQGRKHISESRAAEFRTRLLEWRQIPEPTRISLRELAAEIGTTHQLLSFYLQRLNEWQMNEQAKEYRRQAKAIRDGADAENRSMSQFEMERMIAYEQAAGRCMMSSLLEETFRSFEAEARRGHLSPKIADYLARRLDDPRAQRIARLANRPRKSTRFDAVLKELADTRDSEKAKRLIRQLTPKEREEFWALQEKQRRTIARNPRDLKRNQVLQRNNLPLTTTDSVKSFRST